MLFITTTKKGSTNSRDSIETQTWLNISRHSSNQLQFSNKIFEIKKNTELLIKGCKCFQSKLDGMNTVPFFVCINMCVYAPFYFLFPNETFHFFFPLSIRCISLFLHHFFCCCFLSSVLFCSVLFCFSQSDIIWHQTVPQKTERERKRKDFGLELLFECNF